MVSPSPVFLPANRIQLRARCHPPRSSMHRHHGSKRSGCGCVDRLPDSCQVVHRLSPTAGRVTWENRRRCPRSEKTGCLCRPPEHRQTDTLDSGRVLGVRAGLYRLLSWGGQGPAGAAQSSLRLPIDSMYRSSFPVSIESCFSGGISISKLVKSFMSIIWAVVPEMERTCADFRSTMGT